MFNAVTITLTIISSNSMQRQAGSFRCSFVCHLPRCQPTWPIKCAPWKTSHRIHVYMQLHLAPMTTRFSYLLLNQPSQDRHATSKHVKTALLKSIHHTPTSSKAHSGHAGQSTSKRIKTVLPALMQPMHHTPTPDYLSSPV